MGISSNKQKKTFDEINITPLTDIFLVLLIIMMVIAPLLNQQGLKLSIPGTQKDKTQKQSKLITIDIKENGVYTIEGKVIALNNLVSSIRNASKIKKDGLLIQAAGNATHGAVVSVMDAARNAGVVNISIAEK